MYYVYTALASVVIGIVIGALLWRRKGASLAQSAKDLAGKI